MKISLHGMGVLKNPALKTLFNEYKKRLPWSLDVYEHALKKPPTNPADIKHHESLLLLEKVSSSTPLLLWDERGDNLTSQKMAHLIARYGTQGQSHLSMVVGGAFGVDTCLREKADHVLSLGAMTWPHMLVRVMIIEQLYRCACLINGHPYHKS